MRPANSWDAPGALPERESLAPEPAAHALRTPSLNNDTLAYPR